MADNYGGTCRQVETLNSLKKFSVATHRTVNFKKASSHVLACVCVWVFG